MTTIVKVRYSGFHFRIDGMSWLVMSTPASVPVQPIQYFMPNWNSLPRLTQQGVARRHNCCRMTRRSKRRESSRMILQVSL